jgi:hypothetical protein
MQLNANPFTEDIANQFDQSRCHINNNPDNYEKFKQESRKGPFGSSTPLTIPVKDNIVQTPLSVHNNVGVDQNSRNNESYSISIFENSYSAAGSSSHRNSLRSLSSKQLVKKTLFTGGSPEKSESEVPKTSGDFFDDEDDELFSQVRMPGLDEGPNAAANNQVPDANFSSKNAYCY